MKENILIALVVLIIAGMWIQNANQDANKRYKVISSNNMLTILLDQKTGVTWRNCVCNERSPIPGCWEKMDMVNNETYKQTIGDAKITKIIAKKSSKTELQNTPNTTVIPPSKEQQQQQQ